MTTLTMKDENRLKIMQRVFRGELTVDQGGLVLGISERQGYQIKARAGRSAGSAGSAGSDFDISTV